MNVHLMYKDQDLDLARPLPSNEEALTQDLELPTLFNAMALGDRFLFEVARKVILSSLGDLDTIRYRQGVLRDCLRNPALVRDLHQIPIELMELRRSLWYGIYSTYPRGILYSAVQTLGLFVDRLKQLRRIADEQADQFESEGFTAFWAMIKQELDDEYLLSLDDHLRELRFRDGVLISAALGPGNEGMDYTLRKNGPKTNWAKRLFTDRSPAYSFAIDPRDDHGARALAELQDRGLNLAANAVAQSADHIQRFFEVLRNELAFYVGCLNLHEQLAQMGEPVAFPLPTGPQERRHSFRGLYDVCLALTMRQRVVGNDVLADDKDLVVITGANQGGKSTFLRSIGLAQLMMQCGLFVPAESFSANVCERIFTHYKRQEDATMNSGKLDEELGRMSEIVDHLVPNSLILFNESFAATNEREGSEIARQITGALLERRIKVFYVTHLVEFARRLYGRKMDRAIFLRAERKSDGTRTYRVIEGEPLHTSYGVDLYRQIFGVESAAQHDR